LAELLFDCGVVLGVVVDMATTTMSRKEASVR
jgi:hypothetical protein